ncbi:MAG: DUF4836 family protein [Alistipes sp.]|nr:DUF4836 family protein [Alistipes sp.]
MKKWIFACMGVVAAAAVTFAIVKLCGSDSASSEVPQHKVSDNLMVAYINIDQLATKGAFNEHIDASNRKLLATMMSSAITERSHGDHASNIITDLSTTGLNIEKPAYAYFNEEGGFVLVVDVKDVANVDKTIALMSFMMEQDGNEPLVVERDGNNRIIRLDREAIAAYNNKHLVVVSNTSGEVTTKEATDALKRPISNLSIFGSSDIAIYANCYKGMSMLRQVLETTKAEYEEMAMVDSYYEDSIVEIEETLDLLNTYAAYVKEDANAIISLTFEPGHVVLRTTVNGIDTTEFEGIAKRTNNKHLDYISEDAAIVANIGMNGKRYAEAIELLLASKYFTESEYNTFEVNMIAGIACDAIESINGDLTLAIEDIEGDYDSYYDNFYDEYHTNASFRSIAASAIIDVTDNYIISNLGQFTVGLLHRQDSNHYYGTFSGFDISIGQDDNVFHAGINTTYDRKHGSVADADWLPYVEKSYSYVVVDVDNLMDYSYIEAANKMLMNDMDYVVRDMYAQYVDMCDYIYLSQPSLTEAEIVIVLKDEQTNALKQIVDVFMPTLVGEIMQNL